MKKKKKKKRVTDERGANFNEEHVFPCSIVIVPFFGVLECWVSFQNICSYKYIALNREEIGIVLVLGSW